MPDDYDPYRRPEPPESKIAAFFAPIAFVILASFVVGLIFALGPYYYAIETSTNHRSYHTYEGAAANQVYNEPPGSIKNRFYIGTAIGVVGAIIAWCLITKDSKNDRPR